jgi:hypothetical protein
MFLEILSNPDLIREFDLEEIEEVFISAIEVLKKEPPFLYLNAFKGEAVFIGDTHGDFLVSKYIARKYSPETDRYLIFLGDYIDREPEPEGALYNLLYLCFLKIKFSDRVFLLKGNHEANYAVSCYPYEFDQILIELFGAKGRQLHSITTQLFKEMPLMIKTENGIVASHAGFPLHGQKVDDKSREDLIIDILWADAEASPMFRGYGIPKFTEKQLIKFLNSINASCFIRGHDPYIGGKIIYSKKIITLSTSRTYAKWAGIKITRVKLSEKVENAENITLEDITSYLYTSE